MGRASRHKSRPQAARSTRAGLPAFNAAGRRQLRLLADQIAVYSAESDDEERYRAASRAWCGGSEPVPAATPDWARSVRGQRFTQSEFMCDGAQAAPSLTTVQLPPDTVIAGDPAYWQVAAGVLVRAIVYDGLGPGNAMVRSLAEILAPVAALELRHAPAARLWLMQGDRRLPQPVPAFPIMDGPVQILGLCVLGHVVPAVIGDDATDVDEVELAVLSRALDGVVHGVPGSVVADALASQTNPLRALAESGAVEPGEVIGAGLEILAACVRLFQADATHASRRAA